MQTYVYSTFLDAEIDRLKKQEAEAEALQVQLQYEENRAALAAKDFLPNPPTKGALEGYLYGILFGGCVLGYEELTVTGNTPTTLTPVAKAKKAIFHVEADATSANLQKVMRYKIAEDPTTTEGIPVSDEAVFEVGTRWNLERFKIISTQSAKSHKITVEYIG